MMSDVLKPLLVLMNLLRYKLRSVTCIIVHEESLLLKVLILTMISVAFSLPKESFTFYHYGKHKCSMQFCLLRAVLMALLTMCKHIEFV